MTLMAPAARMLAAHLAVSGLLGLGGSVCPLLRWTGMIAGQLCTPTMPLPCISQAPCTWQRTAPSRCAAPLARPATPLAKMTPSAATTVSGGQQVWLGVRVNALGAQPALSPVQRCPAPVGHAGGLHGLTLADLVISLACDPRPPSCAAKWTGTKCCQDSEREAGHSNLQARPDVWQIPPFSRHSQPAPECSPPTCPTC